MGSYEGRLELTWTNKSRRLLAAEDGSYEWVDPAHYRVDEVSAADVGGKREAAKRWANHVNADVQMTVRWDYLLLAESDVETARRSWPALKRLGGTN